MTRRESVIALVALWVAAIFVYLQLANSKLVLLAAGIGSVMLALVALRPRQALRVADLCFRYRWVIALAVFAVSVLLRLHGSSIGMFDELFPTQSTPATHTLFGMARSVRSDEFGVQTPTFFSQAYNGYGLYSDRMGILPQNMVLDYFAPTWDITVLGKPLAWGYLLFGNEVGLSWYWCGQFVLMFMSALEMCLILTKGHRPEALLGAAMITFSPAVQWWFMPHMPILIMYSMMLFWMGYAFFTSSKVWQKWLLAVAGAVTIAGFCLSFFPSFQVPCAMITIALLVACLVRDRDRILFCKADLIPLVAMFVASGGIVVRFVAISVDDILRLMHTEYPAGRASLGGTWKVRDLFTNVVSLFTPYKDTLEANNSEIATYVHFAPLFLLLVPRLLAYLRKRSNRDSIVCLTFVVILLVQIVYMLVGVPRIVADVTLLRYCARMHNVYGWVATLFSVWGISALVRNPDILSRWEKVVWPCAFVVLQLLLINGGTIEYFSQFELRGITVGYAILPCAICALGGVLALFVHGRRNLAIVLVGIGMLFVGATVNPIERGILAITNHPLSSEIAQISAREPNSRWLTDAFHISNYAMANGAKVLSATNFYPDDEKWRIVDPEGAYATETNRYMNPFVDIVEDKSSVELLGADAAQVHLSVETIRDLDVRYLLTTHDYAATLGAKGIACEKVFEQDGYAIVRLSYEGA